MHICPSQQEGYMGDYKSKIGLKHDALKCDFKMNLLVSNSWHS